MKFTDLFIRRPVLSSVVSLLILILGARSLGVLEIREYPETRNTVVSVTTVYPGASSELVKGFITTPLQQAIAEAEGIDYLTATSSQGMSVIQAHMVLNYDSNAAVSEIQAKVAGQRNVLPSQAEAPVIDSTTGDDTALMYLAFFSDGMSLPEITDYMLRVVQPQLQAVPGVAKAELIGNKQFAMRVWLDPRRMAALDVAMPDVRRVLRANNYLAAVGQVKGTYVAIDLGATTDVNDVEGFRDLVVGSHGGALVRLRDIARVELGAENYDSASWYKGVPAIFVGIQQTPGENPLSVAQRVHRLLPEIRGQLPQGLDLAVPYDASTYIEDSIHEIFSTLVEAVGIVLLVIVLFLGSLRSALVPIVAVPLSLIGAGFIMLMLGYSINLLTLLAMVLAIGLVVDDAIVVVENIYRHIQQGKEPVKAALDGARELTLPILAMTTTLVAVYAPIGFMSGLVGELFTEFAFTLAGAVLVSGVIALTLSPMISSRVLRQTEDPGPFKRGVDRTFEALARRYRALLHHSLDYLPVTVGFGAIALASLYFMFITTPRELAPTEDQSILFFQADAPQTATIDYGRIYTHRIVSTFEDLPEYDDSFIILGRGGDTSTIFGGFKMPPPSERERSQMDLRPVLQRSLSDIPGLDIAVFSRPSLPGSSGGPPVQFVLTSDADYGTLNGLAGNLIRAAMQSGRFLFLRQNPEFNRPIITLDVDRNRAGDLGISMSDIARTLSGMLGGQYVNRFNLDGRAYKVIPQVARKYRLDSGMLNDYYLRAAAGQLVPLSSLVAFRHAVEPSARTQFQQLNSVMLQGVVAPGVTLGEGLGYLEKKGRELVPANVGFDYAGQSRQFTRQGSALVATFFLSVIVIYLVLAAQFESWRDPLIILVSVPLSIAGAMIFMTLGFATINIYTQVGLITLIGLVSKNGILIVEFANQLQRREGMSKRQAVEEAAQIRLRPILMTTVAMLVAMIPLLTASGPGAVSRFDIGLVVASGLGIGTIFTLFVVPAVYVLIARRHTQASGQESAEQAAR